MIKGDGFGIEVKSVAYHRNGVSGQPFHVVLFDNIEGRHIEQCVGIVFDGTKRVAVLNVDKLTQGVIAFGRNSYRGDRFSPMLKQAIKEWKKSEDEETDRSYRELQAQGI
jgi:hypothetical protein